MIPSIPELLKRLDKLDTKQSRVYFCVCKPIHAGEPEEAPYKTTEDAVKAFRMQNNVRDADHLIVFYPCITRDAVIGYTFY